jgi:sugar O-acyltransferase (sialic acid O-acetyltransferase NeuD family)
MKTLVIIGAGGHGRVVADCAQQLGGYCKIIFLDDCYNKSKKSGNWPIVGLVEDFPQYIESSDFIVAFGNNYLRAEANKNLENAKANIISLLHPSATISPNALIGKGVVICANAAINVGTEIADGCIINTGATIDHDCKLQPYVHVSPGVNIAGGVNIDKLSWLGIGSTVIECLTLAENTQVGAGAVVTQSTQENSLYLGIPAKRIRALKNT